MDRDERELLARTLDGAVAAAAASSTPAEALDGALEQIGWHHALAEDPRTAVSLLFDLQGRHGVTSCALDAVIALGLGVTEATDVGTGGESTVVLPMIGAPVAATPGRWCAVAGGGIGVEVGGLATTAMRRAETAWVATCGDDGATSCVAVAAASLHQRPVHGLDPTLGLVRVSGETVAAGGAAHTSGSWSEGVRLGRLALSHELVGTSRTTLRLARDHAVDRIQFGRPIAGFQAVRHRLAEAFVAVEAAEAAVGAAWDDGGVLAASVAKAVAGRSALATARHAQQVLAGIGFTTEHPLHRFVRRALVLDGLLGDARSLQRNIGEELVASGRLPPLVAL
jgi:hypothetical protein